MPGIKGRSGRRKDINLVRFRPHLALRRGKHDKLIEALEDAPPRRQGIVLLAIVETGSQEVGLGVAASIRAEQVALAAQERAEIDLGLAGLGNAFDE
jgi:hypothetical protein